MYKTQSKLKGIYQDFFRQANIDPKTGYREERRKKFATYPYVGSCYGETGSKRLLMLGLDIGIDGTFGRLQSFEERRFQIEGKSSEKHNRHMAGTYMMALHFLHSEFKEWDEYWVSLDMTATCLSLMKQKDLPERNPLSYIALTNCYKFVTEFRDKARGGQDRKFCYREPEQELLTKEIIALDPSIVVWQGRSFPKKNRPWLQPCLSGREVWHSPHPSYVGVQRVQDLIMSLENW